MSEIAIGGNDYRLLKMPTRVQFNVARRLAPVVMHMRGALTATPADAAVDQAVFLGALEPLVQAIGGLADDVCDYVLDNCLAAVRRVDGRVLAPVWNAQAKVMQFDDITMPEMLQLTAAVLKDNLGGFFPAGLSGSSPAEDSPSASTL